MRLISLFFLLFNFLYGLKVVVDTTDNYSVLTITNEKKFECKRRSSNTILCSFSLLPSTPVFETDTLFFHLTPFISNQKFFLKIETTSPYLLKGFEKNLYEGYEKRVKELKRAKKWVVISYKGKRVPFLSNKKMKGLKFPLKVQNEFYLKAVDIDSNPIDADTETADVVEYFLLSKLYNRGTLSIDKIDEFLRLYPDSLFVPDVLFLKLSLLFEMGEYEKVISLGNSWLQKYSFNENLPDVLLLLARSYSKEAQTEDATYMFERVLTEYDKTKYAYKAMIYLADQLFEMGDTKRAFQLYKQALRETKDREIAMLSASRLGERYLEENNVSLSLNYYQKLFKADKNYLLRDKEQAYQLIKEISAKGGYSFAIELGEELLKSLDQNDEIYEELIYNLSLWAYKFGDYGTANRYIELYIDKFPYGDYRDKIDQLRDKVLFELNDNNKSLMLQRYVEIMERYKGTELADKAFRKRVYLLYKLKRYRKILEMNSSRVSEINSTILEESAKNGVIEDLNRGNCKEAISYYHKFKIKLSREFDEKLFNCAYEVKDFNLASIIPNRYLLSSNKKQLLKWLINKEKVFEATYNYKKVVLIIDDICNLLKKDCYEWRYKQFFAYYYLGDSKSFLKIASSFFKKRNIKNIDIFMKVIEYAVKNRNTLLIYTYAKKVLELQKFYKSYVYSPYVDFLFVDASKKMGKKEEAIKVLKELVKLKGVGEEDKARAYYQLSSLTSDKRYLYKCLELKNSKTWRPLCKDSLEVLGE